MGFVGRDPAAPAAIGFAILKYHLYDIDVVISKTIVYGSLAAFITAVYCVLVVVGIGHGIRLPYTGARARTWPCPSWPPRWWRWCSSRSGSGCSGENRLVFGKRATPYEALSEFACRMGGTYAAEDALPADGPGPGRRYRR